MALSFPAEAQQDTNVAKIGWLGARSFGPDERQRSGAELFFAEFSKLGYVDGKNVTIEYRYADNNFDRLPALAHELVRLKVNLLLAAATREALAAKSATRTIPIIFFGVPDPVASGLVDSMARPGRNVTGFTSISAVLAGKRLELLKETIPNLSRVAVLWNPQNLASAEQWRASQKSSQQLGLQLHSAEVSSVDQFEHAFKEAVKANTAALAVTQETVLTSNIKRVFDLAAIHQLPAIYTRRDFVETAGLMSYGPDRSEPFRRAAFMAERFSKARSRPTCPWSSRRSSSWSSISKRRRKSVSRSHRMF